jgi:tryptophan synthase beta chain
MGSYDRYFAGELEDFAYPEEAIKESLLHLPKVG